MTHAQPTSPPPRSAVVVGASGILAPLGALLREPGVMTVGVSRGGRLGEGDWDRRVALDATDPVAVRRLRDDLGPGYRLVGYAPALVPASWAVLAGAAAAQLLVVTSGWPAEDDDWALDPACALLRLGWTGPAGASRWHTPAEVARAAARLVGRGPGSTESLGRTAPAADKPRAN